MERGAGGEVFEEDGMNGLLVLDKPGGITSRAAVNAVQRWFPRGTKIGHTGTLDPLATGVLVLCVGAATRLAEFVQAMGKGYVTRIRLGATSTTDDADGDVTVNPSATPPTEEAVRAALSPFVGTVQQLPPAFSALKVDGRRAHELARKGEEVKLDPRPVRIDRIDLVRYEWPHLEVSVECGKGTYVRSLARDVGAALGVGGLVETLRRTHVGPFAADTGLSLDADPAAARAALRPMAEAVADLPRLGVVAAVAARFRQGQNIPAAGRGPVAVFAGDVFVGVGDALAGRVRPKLVV